MTKKTRLEHDLFLLACEKVLDKYPHLDCNISQEAFNGRVQRVYSAILKASETI